MGRGRVAAAIAVAGVLDILSAFVFANVNGTPPTSVLTVIATGPFGAGIARSGAAPVLGLIVHFGIMTAMVLAFAFGARRFAAPLAKLGPVLVGVAYGVALYLVMYWIVLPLRWPSVHPQVEVVGIAKALFAHIVCVGIPIAFLLLPYRCGAASAAHADT